MTCVRACVCFPLCLSSFLSSVSNIASVSGLSILDCPFGSLLHLLTYPVFCMWRTKSCHVSTPSSIEIYTPIKSSLYNLFNTNDTIDHMSGCFIRGRNCLPFTSLCVHPLFLGMVTFVQPVLIPQNTIEYMSNITGVL